MRSSVQDLTEPKDGGLAFLAGDCVDGAAVPYAMLRNWRNGSGGREAGSARHPIPAAAPHSAPDPAAEISRLRRENDRLRTERDILKKAVAIFSEPPR